MDGKKLYRSRSNRMICGICGGLAEYFNVDATVIRLVLVFLGLSSCGTFTLAYLISAIIIPEDPAQYE